MGHSRSTSAAELSFRDGQKSIPGITPGPIQVLASGLGASCFQVRTQPENLEDASPHKPLNVVLTAAAELQIAVKSEPAPPPARVEVLVLAPKAEFDENAVTLAAAPETACSPSMTFVQERIECWQDLLRPHRAKAGVGKQGTGPKSP